MAQALKDLLPSILTRHGIRESVGSANVVEETNRVMIELFGAGFERRARATQFRDGMVIIQVDSSVVASELRFQEEHIRVRLRERGVMVPELRIQLGGTNSGPLH